MHQTIHPLIGGEVYIDSKSANRIDLSRFVQYLLNLYCFQGGPPFAGGGGGWVEVRVGGVSPTLVYIFMHMYTHIFTHIPIHVNHDKYGCLYGSGHLQFLNM